MLNHFKNDSFSWVLLIGAFVLLLEVIFFNEGVIFSLFVSGAMVYFGRKLSPKRTGKMLFWVGLFMLISSVIGMMTLRLFLFAILIYIIYQYAQSKKQPEVIRPIVEESEPLQTDSTVIEQSSLFKNTMFGHQKTPDHVYEWNDINIVTGIGDTVIDFTYTVLPKGETVIFIRNFIGNVKVYIPYDVEVNVRHASLAGASEILDYKKERSFNQVVTVRTPGYNQADQKIKIFTSMLVGDLEVKRI